MIGNGDRLELWFMAFACAWIICGIAASAVYRRSKGKAILSVAPDNALFVEKWTSGRELGGIRSLGGANNCLIVAVTIDTLSVTPCFPFTLLFLPEIWGLEHRIPTRDIRSVEERTGILRSTQVIAFGFGRKIELRLRDPEGFRQASKKAGVA